MYLYIEATVSPAARTSLGDAKSEAWHPQGVPLHACLSHQGWQSSSMYSAIQCKTCILKLYHFWEDLWMQEGQGRLL